MVDGMIDGVRCWLRWLVCLAGFHAWHPVGPFQLECRHCPARTDARM